MIDDSEEDDGHAVYIQGKTDLTQNSGSEGRGEEIIICSNNNKKTINLAEFQN